MEGHRVKKIVVIDRGEMKQKNCESLEFFMVVCLVSVLLKVLDYGPTFAQRKGVTDTLRPPQGPDVRLPSVEATQPLGLWLVRSLKPDAEP